MRRRQRTHQTGCPPSQPARPAPLSQGRLNWVACHPLEHRMALPWSPVHARSSAGISGAAQGIFAAPPQRPINSQEAMILSNEHFFSTDPRLPRVRRWSRNFALLAACAGAARNDMAAAEKELLDALVKARSAAAGAHAGCAHAGCAHAGCACPPRIMTNAGHMRAQSGSTSTRR